MARAGLSLVVFLALAAWAGAQGPAPLTAADQLRLLRANRLLLDDLIGRGIELGAADSPLDRAAACQATAHALAVAIQRAAEAQDTDRVAEIGEHFETVVRDGLGPTLDEARRVTPPGSPGEKKLKELRETANGDLKGVRDAIPNTGKVKDVRDKLDGLQDKLK
jgi:hypothetical protein